MVTPIVPDHETLRHFEKVRLGNDGMDAIMDALCIQVVKAGDKLELKIGENGKSTYHRGL